MNKEQLWKALQEPVHKHCHECKHCDPNETRTPGTNNVTFMLR